MTTRNLLRRTLAFALISSACAFGQVVTEPRADRLPPQLSDVSIEQKLNTQVPLSLTFHDESGAPVQLQQFFHPGRPVVLSLVYFNCRMLCSETLTSMADSLRLVKFDAGKQFEILTVSFDSHDTPATASAAKKKYLAMYNHPGAENGWHFLTGDAASIQKLADTVGFHFRWDPRTQQFAHAAGIMLLTPQGRIAQYYYGARYFPSDLRLGLVESSQNHIGTLADQIVLYCYHWDPRTGRYGAIVSRIIQISGGFTLLVLGGAIWILFRKYPNEASRKAAVQADTVGTKPSGAASSLGRRQG